MRNIPCFTTEYGIASLILKEIPYRNAAYVRIQSAYDLDHLLLECCDFCRMAGANHVYATGHQGLAKYPFHTEIQLMRSAKDNLPDTDACLFPVTEQTLDKWRDIYNDKMRSVDNAAYLTISDAKDLLEKKSPYFIHKDGVLQGIGLIDGDRVACVASVTKGAGREIMAALCHGIFSESITVEVASSNEKAIRLYKDLGFISVSVISTWYQIF